MLIRIIIIIFLTPLLSYSGCNNLQLADLPSVIDLNNNLSPKITFEVTRTLPSDSCDYVIGVDRGVSTSYARKLFNGNHFLEFALSPRNNMNVILKDPIDTANSSEYISESFNQGNKTATKIKVYAELTLNPNAYAGFYQDTYQFKLYEMNNGNLTLIHTRPVQFFYNVPENVSLSLVNTNASFDPLDTSQDINFGVLTQGALRSMDIVIQSSSGYSLNISSANNGKIKHTAHTSTIDYIFRANGQTINLSGSDLTPVTISTGTGSHPADGFRIPLQFEIGNIENKVSGEYRDNLTLTVTSNL